MKAIAWSVAPLLPATGGYFLWSRAATAAEVTTFRTGKVVASIDATGTVEPEEVVDVGAQVAGMILAFGTGQDGKPIDYGSEVEAAPCSRESTTRSTPPTLHRPTHSW